MARVSEKNVIPENMAGGGAVLKLSLNEGAKVWRGEFGHNSVQLLLIPLLFSSG